MTIELEAVIFGLFMSVRPNRIYVKVNLVDGSVIAFVMTSIGALYLGDGGLA